MHVKMKTKKETYIKNIQKNISKLKGEKPKTKKNIGFFISKIAVGVLDLIVC